MRVNEIFYSLQGEGAYSGVPSIFVRLSGCNLQCDFCDTQHKQYTEKSIEQIYEDMKAYPAKHLVFTGGEPTLQLNNEILSYFHTKGYSIQIESNGTRDITYPHCWITCSPKDAFCRNAEIHQNRIDEIKVVFNGENDPEKYLQIRARRYYLQPCDTGNAEKNGQIMNACIDYILKHPQWRMSLQTQKIIKVR